MKKLLILLTIAIFAISGCDAVETVEYSDTPENSETQSYAQDNIEINNIKNINLGDATILNLSQNETEKLEISGPNNVMPHIKAVISGDTITLGVNETLLRTGDVTFTMQVKDLNSLNIYGASTASAESFNVDTFLAGVSGASTLTISNLTAELLVADLQGASTATINGS